eukprot:3778750-Amphidinium_carterae.2
MLACGVLCKLVECKWLDHHDKLGMSVCSVSRECRGQDVECCILSPSVYPCQMSVQAPLSLEVVKQ